MLGRDHFYHQSIRRTVAVFGTLFNDINVLRTDSSGRVLNQARVPLAYGPHQKFLARIQQQEDIRDDSIAIKLPRMSFEIDSISYDGLSKVQKLHQEVVGRPAYGTDNKNKVIGPVVYRLGITLSIMTKTQDDALQILEQIIPFFQPQYTVTVKEVDGTISSDYPFALLSIDMSDDYEGEFETRRAIIYQLQFETRVRFYGPIEEAPTIKKTIITSNILAGEGDRVTVADQETQVTWVDPMTAEPDDPHTIQQKIFDPFNLPTFTDLTLSDATGLQVGDIIIGTTSATAGTITAINNNEVTVSSTDGFFILNEGVVDANNRELVTIDNIVERWS